MEKRIQEILSTYKNEISEIANLNLNVLSNIEKGIHISRRHLQELRIVLRSGTFENKTDEIRFFKEQKPYIFGRLKFYIKLYIFSTHRPLGSLKFQRSYIDAEIKKLQVHYQKNIDFVKYYRENSTVLDEFYFVRGNDNLNLISDTSHFYTDSEFSTSHDNAVAKIIAYDLLLAFYIEELNTLEVGKKNSSQSACKLLKLPKLTWTGNKIDVIELIYALHNSGSINKGTADIKEIAVIFEQVLNIDLGNYYHIFVELKARKTKRTKFLDYLKESLIKRMDESDE